jgi:DNA-binding beta-propeller fold protein YncE
MLTMRGLRAWVLAATLVSVGCGPSKPVGVTKDGGTDQMAAAGADGQAPETSGAAGGGFAVVPGAFALETPADGDPTVTSQPTFTWEAAPGAATYEIEIATSPAFGADDVVMKTGLPAPVFAQVTALTPGTIFYWRVSAVNAVGRTPASGSPFIFSSPFDAGPFPHGVAVTPDGKTAVVSNDRYPGSVTFVDLATFKKAAVAVKGHPGMVAVTPDGTRALVAEGVPNDVVMFDLATTTPVGTFAPPCPATTLYGLAVKADGSAALIPDLSAGCTKDVLDVVALPAGTLGMAVDLQTKAGSFGVAVTPDGKTALVTHGGLGTSIRRVDFGPNGVAVETLAGTGASFGVAITPDGKEALISSGEGQPIKRVSLAASAVTGMIDHDSNQDVGNLAIAPDGKHAVVVGDAEVAVVSLADGKVVSTHALAGRSVAVTPDGSRALVTGAGATGKVYVIKLP